MPTRRRSVPWIIVITLLGGALRLFHLGHDPLWLDEVSTYEAARALLDGGIDAMIAIDGTSPVYTALAALCVKLAGADEVAVRLPAALAGTAAVPATYALVRTMFSRRDLALAAAGALAISPFGLWFSHEARGYSLIILFSVLSAYCGWRAVVVRPVGGESRSSVFRWVALSCALAWLGLGCHATFVLMLASIGLLLLIRRRSWAALGWWVLAQSLGVLAYLPWVLLNAGEASRSLGLARPGQAPALIPVYTVMSATVGFTLGAPLRDTLNCGVVEALRLHMASSVVVLIVGLILGWTLFRVLPRVVRGARSLLTVWIFAPVALLLMAVLLAGIGPNVRYICGIVVPISIVIGALWVHAWRARRLAVAALVVLGALLWSDANLYFAPIYGKDDLRSIVPIIDAQLQPGDTLLIANETALPALEFYGFTCPSHSLLIRSNSGLRALRAASSAPEQGRTVVVEYRDWENIPKRDLAFALAPLGPVERVWRAPGSEILIFPKRVVPQRMPGIEEGCRR